MAVESFTCDLYPLTNYEISAKDAQPPKDKQWTEKMQRLKKVVYQIQTFSARKLSY